MNWESQFISPCNIRIYELFVSWEFLSRGSLVTGRPRRNQRNQERTRLSCSASEPLPSVHDCHLRHKSASTRGTADKRFASLDPAFTISFSNSQRCDKAPLSEPSPNPLKCELFLALCSRSLMWSDYKEGCHIYALQQVLNLLSLGPIFILTLALPTRHFPFYPRIAGSNLQTRVTITVYTLLPSSFESIRSILLTIATFSRRRWGCQPYASAALYPRKIPGIHFC
jgi:hypothetical protein